MQFSYQDTLGDLMTKIPTDLSHIIGKIKDSEWFRGAFSAMSKKEKKSMRDKDVVRASELATNSITSSSSSTSNAANNANSLSTTANS